MPAILEALCFYAFALDFGPRWSTPGRADVVLAYRAVNVQARPPIDISVLDAAKTSTARMLETLI
jgi:hypothetical protein